MNDRLDSHVIAQFVNDLIIMGNDGTVSAAGTDLPSRGYWVGGIRPSLINPAGPRDVEWFIEGTPSAEYFGVWTDQQDGTVYVDACDWTPSRGNALAMARERGELAVWDIARCQEIRTDTVNQGAY